MEDKTFQGEAPGSLEKSEQDRLLEQRRRSKEEFAEMRQLIEETSKTQTQVIIYLEPRRRFLFF